MGMIEQTAHQRPGFAGIAAFEQSRRLNSAVEHVWLFRTPWRNLPDVFQRDAGVGGESDGSLLRVGPTPAEIVARAQHRSPIARRRSPDTGLISARIVGESVYSVAVKIGAAYLPAAALQIGAQHERSLRGSHQ